VSAATLPVSSSIAARPRRTMSLTGDRELVCRCKTGGDQLRRKKHRSMARNAADGGQAQTQRRDLSEASVPKPVVVRYDAPRRLRFQGHWRKSTTRTRRGGIEVSRIWTDGQEYEQQD